MLKWSDFSFVPMERLLQGQWPKQMNWNDKINDLWLKTWTWGKFSQRFCHASWMVHLIAMIIFILIFQKRAEEKHMFLLTTVLSSPTPVLIKLYSAKWGHLVNLLYFISPYLKYFAIKKKKQMQSPSVNIRHN